jgi:hypothetical protein
MVAIQRANMKTNEFVYIIPWLAHLHDHLPWESSNVEKNEGYFVEISLFNAVFL